MQKIAVLGVGAFGFAIAKIISENHPEKEISVFDINEEFIDSITKTGKHPLFHGSTKLTNVSATNNLAESVKDADLLILAMPSESLRKSVREIKEHLTKKTIFLNLAKGLEENTNMRMSEIIREELRDNADYDICCLSGGMFAKEIVSENPVCGDLACQNRETAKKVARFLWNDSLRIETTDDLIGVELAGPFKNVIAVGAGMLDGLGFAVSSKAAFVSSAAREMKKLAASLGAREETFDSGSQAWFGDLMTTCFGKSRNRELGELIGKGMNVKEAVQKMAEENKSIEGYATSKVVFSLIQEKEIDSPLLTEIHNVLYSGTSPQSFAETFVKS